MDNLIELLYNSDPKNRELGYLIAESNAILILNSLKNGGNGDGYSYGNGDGYGNGNGNGDGDGYGDGYGDSNDYGDGYGDGNGYGDCIAVRPKDVAI